MKSELRPLTLSERQELRSFIRYKPGGIDDFLFNWLIGGGFATLVVVFVVSKIGALSTYLPQIAITSGIITGIAAFYLAQKRRLTAKNNFRSAIVEDLKNGKAEITTYNVSEAIAVKEFEDEGTGFYLKVGQQQVLFVVGQFLDDLVAEEKFPSTTIQLVRSPIAQIPLNLKPLGTYLSPLGTMPPFTAKDFDNESIPNYGDLLMIDFELLKQESR